MVGSLMYRLYCLIKHLRVFLSRRYLTSRQTSAGICASMANATVPDVTNQLAFHIPVLVLW